MGCHASSTAKVSPLETNVSRRLHKRAGACIHMIPWELWKLPITYDTICSITDTWINITDNPSFDIDRSINSRTNSLIPNQEPVGSWLNRRRGAMVTTAAISPIEYSHSGDSPPTPAPTPPPTRQSAKGLVKKPDKTILFYSCFHDHLAELYPDIHKIFKGSIRLKSKFLSSLLQIIIKKLDWLMNDRPRYIAAVEEFVHFYRSFQFELYEAIGRSLFFAIQVCCGDLFSTEKREAWISVYSFFLHCVRSVISS